MKLTGQCKEDFEKWAKEQRNFKIVLGQFSWSFGLYSTPFYRLPDSMQYGVLVDFFDANGIRISILDRWPNWFVRFSLYDGDIISDKIIYKTRHKAREEAIKAANDIYNENK